MPVFMRAGKFFGTALFAVLCVFALSAHVHAQSALSVSITPPLFKLAIDPGDTWSSTIKVINNNFVPVTYYAQVMDFTTRDETGNADLVPLVTPATSTPSDSFSLAHWISLPQPAITVGAGASGQLPFTIKVPKNAEPGGHYAAILIGTQPSSTPQGISHVNISSYVSSLIFVNIKGDVQENGRVREFTTVDSLYQSPRADFLLRFENIGNTHVRPEGVVSIYNMWGKERGTVLINHDTHGNFGNVLPHSTRRFQFSWEGDSNIFDIGLYSAVATLNYGTQAKRSVSATTYFWVVPVVPVTVGLSAIVLFFLITVWLMRRYVRRVLMAERQQFGVVVDESALVPATQSTQKTQSARMLPRLSWWNLVKKHHILILVLVWLASAAYVALGYFTNVLTPQRNFQIKDVQVTEENL